MEIPTNTAVDNTIELAVEYIVKELANNNQATITWMNNKIGRVLNEQQAYQICAMFKAKGYHHEIRMHSNPYKTFFYCVTISKTPIRSNDARCAWSVNVA